MPFGEPGAYWLLLGPEGAELQRTDYDLSWLQRAFAIPIIRKQMILPSITFCIRPRKKQCSRCLAANASLRRAFTLSCR